MSASISFNEIPQTDWDLPRVVAEVRPSYTNTAVAEYPTRTLIIAPKLAAASGAASVPFRVTRLADVTARAGAGSIAEDMARDFISANPFSELWMVLVAEAGGAAKAVGTFAYTGSPSGAGTIARYIAGRRVAINIGTSDTPTTIAAALRDAINAIPEMPVVATAATGTCTVTAKHAIDTGNAITLLANLAQDEATPTGLGETITAMAGGSGAIDLTAAIAACASTWYAFIVLPCTDSTNMGLIITELTRRYAATGHLDSLAFASVAGTLSALSAYGPARNSPLLSALGAPVMTGITTAQPPWRLAAAYAAQATFALAQDPARQLKTLPLKGIRAPIGGNFIDSERNILVKAGITTFDVAPDGTCFLERAVSTNTTDSAGVPTKGWQDIMAAAVASRIRYDFRTYIQLNYPRHKLAPNGSPAADNADNTVTYAQLLASWAARCVVYQNLGWIENIAATLPLAICQPPPDGTRNRAQMRLPYQRMGNLMQLDMAMEFQA